MTGRIFQAEKSFTALIVNLRGRIFFLFFFFFNLEFFQSKIFVFEFLWLLNKRGRGTAE